MLVIVNPLSEFFKRAPQLEIVPLVIYITTGNIHPQKFMQTYTKMFA